MIVKCPHCPAQAILERDSEGSFDKAYKLLCPVLRERQLAESGADCPHMREAIKAARGKLGYELRRCAPSGQNRQAAIRSLNPQTPPSDHVVAVRFAAGTARQVVRNRPSEVALDGARTEVATVLGP